MANKDVAFGLRLIGTDHGGEPRVEKMAFAASEGTKSYVGDLVKLDAACGDSDKGCQTVARCSAGNPAVGVVVGLEPRPSALETLYRPASTLQYCYVCTDPGALYEIESSGQLNIDDYGLNADIATGTANDAMGRSGMKLDVSAMDTTATRVLKIIRGRSTPDNDFNSTNTVMVVKINNHQRGAGTGTLAVT